MKINKYNLLINQNFEKYTFSNQTDDCIFKTMTDNMTQNSLFLVLSTKPIDSTTSLTITINDVTQLYIFPTDTLNVSFKVGEMIQTVDNEAIFVISNYISDNLFALRLVQCKNETNYVLKNNTQSLIYNYQLEKKWFDLNTNKNKVLEQYDNYTNLLNSSNALGNFLSNKITVDTDYTTDFTISFDFTPDANYLQLYNIIDKFYLNIQVYDYNDYKYIYMRDIIDPINTSNYNLTSTNSLIGILKTSNTKILPHKVFKLQKNNLYTFTDTVLNKYTSHQKSYTSEKLLVILQLSLKDKSTLYDINNNIESDSIFIIV